MIREKKLSNQRNHQRDGVLPKFFLNAVPRLTAEYKKLAKKQGIELQHPKPLLAGMWIEETVMETFVTAGNF